MSINENRLTDSFARRHNYLRISLTERCNFHCTYCMPAVGIQFSPRDDLMTAEEIFEIASIFVDLGVTNIRLAGGEPLVRKDFSSIVEKLSMLGVTLCVSTNGILLNRYLSLFKECNVRHINVSLYSLDPQKFNSITRRDEFERVMDNIELMLNNDFNVKLNTVLINNFNDNEIVDFIDLTKNNLLHVRFIEFMPFDGNNWGREKLLSYSEILDKVTTYFPNDKIMRIGDRPNDTSRNYRIKSYTGTFAIISSITNPFCDTCNRIRLTANGHLKNCLFSDEETNLLKTFRTGGNIEELIKLSLLTKHKIRAGLDTLEKIEYPDLNTKNRSMIKIGG